MRNITVFPVLVIILICAHYANAQEHKSFPYTFSTSANFGMLYGHAEEIVFPYAEHKAEKLSQLLWDIKPVFYYGLSLNFSRIDPLDKWGFFADISLKNAILSRCGRMEDRDWMSTENNLLTHYSAHDNVINNLFLTDIYTGASFPIKGFLLIKPHINISLMHLAFSAQYGYGLYAEDHKDGTYGPFSEAVRHSWEDWDKVVNYTQRWFSFGTGFSFGYYFLDHFSAELSFRINPLVLCNDLDEHLTTNKSSGQYSSFRDYMRGGIFIEPGAQLSWFITKRLELSMNLSWRYVSGTRGDTWGAITVGSADYMNIGEAGAGLSFIDWGLCLKLRF